MYSYVEQNPVNWNDPLGLTKGGKQNISGNDPLTDGVGKQSRKEEIQNAIKNVEKALKDPTISQARKDYLKGWLKVAKRGFKFGGLLGILSELLDPDELNAEEPIISQYPEPCK